MTKRIGATLLACIAASVMAHPTAAQNDAGTINNLHAVMKKIGPNNVKSITLLGESLPGDTTPNKLTVNDPKLLGEFYDALAQSTEDHSWSPQHPSEIWIEFKHPVILGETLAGRAGFDFDKTDETRSFGPKFRRTLIDLMVAIVDNQSQWFDTHSEDVVSVQWPDADHLQVLSEVDRQRLRAAFCDLDPRAFNVFAPNPTECQLILVTRDGKRHVTSFVYETPASGSLPPLSGILLSHCHQSSNR